MFPPRAATVATVLTLGPTIGTHPSWHAGVKAIGLQLATPGPGNGPGGPQITAPPTHDATVPSCRHDGYKQVVETTAGPGGR